MPAIGGIVNDLILLIYAGLIMLLIIGWGRWLKDIPRAIRQKRLENARRMQLEAEFLAQAPEILAKLEKDHDLTAIPKAFCWLLTGDDPASKLQAAQSMAKLVSLLPITRLLKLDLVFREQTSLDWEHDWKREDPANLLLPSLSDSEKAVILGLASFHSNGYFRERAIGALSLMTTGAELPYLVIRLNDWVPAIWNRSNTAVLRRLNPQNARAIIAALPLIFRLRGRSRHDHHELVDASIATLSKPDARPELELGLRSKDSMIRQCCYRVVLEAGIFDNSTLLGRLIKEPLPTNRSLILDHIRADLTPEEFQPYRSTLLRDKSAPVRLTALRSLHQFNPAESIAELELAVSDDDPAVREAARFLLKKYDDTYDFPRMYREILRIPSIRNRGAISGLGETGHADDTRYIMPFLKADKVRMVRSCVRAMAKLDFLGSKDALIAFLVDPRPGIAKEARRLLYGRINAIDAERIRRDYFQNKPDALRQHAAFLLCCLDKWDAPKYLLEFCADQSKPIAEFGLSALSKWLSRYNCSFTTPSRAQLEAVQNALKAYGSAIPDETRRPLEFLLKGFDSGEASPRRFEAWTRPGVVDLRDLAARNAGHPLAITRFLEAAKLAPHGLASVLFAPPRVVIAIVPVDDAGFLGRSRAWLEDAAHIVAIRAREGAIADDDPDLEEAVKSEWRDQLAAFSVPVELVDWRRDEDVSAAIERAVVLSKSTAPPPPSAAPPSIVEHLPGPRISVESLPSGGEIERLFAAHLMPSPGQVTLFAGNGSVDLTDPSAVVRFDDDDAAGGVTARGRRLVPAGRDLWRIDEHHFASPGHLAIGFDGHRPVGWAGHRTMAYWLYSGNHGVGFLSASDYDFPCGPAKKLYGYADNDPVGVSLAPDLDVVGYRFERDVLVTSAIPIPWRNAGPLLVADFPRDPLRALFFAKTPDGVPTDDLLDEDARDRAPELVLGPTAEARYAVDLSNTVYRVTSVKPWVGAIARVGGPGEGFAVFNAAHQEVRRAGGRLLGGWWRWATVLDAGAYWREDLATGKRYRIAPAEGELLFAIGVPWTKNVVVFLEDKERWWAQLV